MPIRLIDSSAALGQVASTLADSTAALTGTHVAPASRTGTIGPQLAPLTGSLTGEFQANANRTGPLSASLSNAISAIVGSVSGAPTVTQSALKYHPGHWGQLRTPAGVKTSEAVIQADLAVIAANAAEANIVGWAANFSWKQIETAQGVYDWTIPDRYFSACKAVGKRFIFRLDYRRYIGDGTQSVVPAYLFPAGQVATADGGATPRDWEAGVMDRIIAFYIALAARYDADSMFEGVQGMVETAITFDDDGGWPTPANYTTPNKKTQYKRWMDAVRGPSGFRQSQVWFGQNYLGNQDGSDCEEMIRYAIPLRISCAGPDTWQFSWVVPPAQAGKRPIWNDEVLRGVRGSGFDYRPYVVWPREAQGTEMGGYIGNFLPQDILQTANYDSCQYMIWDYNTAANNPGSTPATQWGNGSTQGILWVIRNFPLNNTANPYTQLFDLFMSPTGSGTAAAGGTVANPWPLSMLNDTTARNRYRGKRVGLLDGAYNISGVATRTGGFNALLEMHGGTGPSAPTIIEAVNRRQAIIDGHIGSSYPHKDCPLLGDYESGFGYLHLIGLKITGGGSKGVFLGGSSAPRIPGYVVTDCEFTGFDCRGVAGGGNYSCLELHHTTGQIVRDNYLHDNIGHTLNSSDHWAGIQNFNVTDGLYEHNTLIQSGGIYGKNDGIHGNTLRYNYVDVGTMGGSSFGGLQDWAGSAETGNVTRIHNNICVGSYLNDFRKSDGGGGWYSSLELYNNLFSTISSSGASYGMMMRAGAGKVKIFNNIIMEAGTGDHCYIALNVDAPGVLDYNLYYRSSGSANWQTFPSQTNNNRSSYGTFAAWKAAFNVAVEANGISGSNPLFVGTGMNAAKYQLQSGSPAKNAGKSNGTVNGTTTDIGPWGNGAIAIGHRW